MNESLRMKEPQPLAEEEPGAEATQGVLGSARAWAASVAMLGERLLRLGMAEGRLAGKSLGTMVVLGFIGVLWLGGGWLYFCAAVTVALVNSGLGWVVALLSVSVIQFIMCAAALIYAAKRRRHLQFEATRRQLNLVRERYARNS